MANERKLRVRKGHAEFHELGIWHAANMRVQGKTNQHPVVILECDEGRCGDFTPEMVEFLEYVAGNCEDAMDGGYDRAISIANAISRVLQEAAK